MKKFDFEGMPQTPKDRALLMAVKRAVVEPREAEMDKIEALVKAGANPLALFDGPFEDGFVYDCPNKGCWDFKNVNAFECMMMVYRRSKWLLAKEQQRIPGHLRHVEDMPLSEENTIKIMRLFLQNGMDLTTRHAHYSCFFKSRLDARAESQTFFDNFLSSSREMKFIVALEDDLPETLNIDPEKHRHFIPQWSSILISREDGKEESKEVIEWKDTVIKACAILVKKGVALPADPFD
ncbi:MAG: hypothetical protein LBU87_05065, partial [Lactobacillales bacterium]|nr:hypothetical protein [Lactobacillales bacterium]